MEFIEVQVLILLVTSLIVGAALIILMIKIEKLQLKLNALIASRNKVHRPVKPNPKELFSAVYDNDVNQVAYLVKVKGIHPELRDPDDYDWTPLMIASRKGYIEIVKFLCAECNVNVNAKDSEGWTALHLAANRNNIEVVKYLIEEQNADSTKTDEGGNTVLHLAAYKGYYDLVQYICEKCPEILHNTNNNGQTAAEVTRDQGFRNIYLYLLQQDNQNE